MASFVATEENPFVFPISDKVKDEVAKQDVWSLPSLITTILNTVYLTVSV